MHGLIIENKYSLNQGNLRLTTVNAQAGYLFRGLVLLRPVLFSPTYGGSWAMAGATFIEVIATLPSNNLWPAVTGLEQVDRKVV